MSIHPVNHRDGHYYEDSRGNKWLDEWLQKRYPDVPLVEAAELASNKLINCDGCVNCASCTNCTRCINCHSCKQCEDCTDCIDCNTCVNCTKCILCELSMNCYSCQDNYNCSSCIHCDKCNTLSGCIRCTSCSNCMLIRGALDLDEHLLHNYSSIGAMKHVKHILAEIEETNMLPKCSREDLLINIIAKASDLLADKKEMISEACQIEGVYERLHPSEGE